jgi:hypothetical protein
MRFDAVLVAAPTATGSVERARLLETLSAHGLEVVQRGPRLLIGEGADPLAIDAKAELVPVATDAAVGWLAVFRAAGLPSIVWVGALKGAAWRARPISINDCPAKASVQPSGIEIAYGERLLLPHGGGSLEEVALDVPPFANRLELEPLGLAFGRADPSRPQARCREGWGEGRVLIRRVPPGNYTLVWMGGGKIEEARISVKPHAPAPPKKPPHKR